jgi:hypothetical protein
MLKHSNALQEVEEMEEKSQLIHVGIPLQTGKKYSALMIEME